MSTPTPTPIMQFERAWHRLMVTLGQRHPDTVSGNQALLRQINKRMARR